MDSKKMYRVVLGLGIMACFYGGLTLDVAGSWAANEKAGAMDAAALAPEVVISYSSSDDYKVRKTQLAQY